MKEKERVYAQVSKTTKDKDIHVYYLIKTEHSWQKVFLVKKGTWEYIKKHLQAIKTHVTLLQFSCFCFTASNS